MSAESSPPALARRLFEAYRDGRPTAADGFADLSVPDAYAVQRAFVSARVEDDGPVVGYKLGCTNETVQQEIGVPEPIYGRLLAATVDVDAVRMRELIVPRAEPELVVRLGEPLVPSAARDQVERAVETVAPAIEVVDSRTGRWELEPGTAIADNALAARLVTGPERPLDELPALADIGVTVATAGTERTGRGAAVLGDPLDAVAWLSRTRAETVPADTLISTGSVTATVPLGPGTAVRASFQSLGEVTVRPE